MIKFLREEVEFLGKNMSKGALVGKTKREIRKIIKRL
jgi:hypothetical protein